MLFRHLGHTFAALSAVRSAILAAAAGLIRIAVARASVLHSAAVCIPAIGTGRVATGRLFAALLEACFFLFAINLLHLHDERYFTLCQADDRLLCADAK